MSRGEKLVYALACLLIVAVHDVDSAWKDYRKVLENNDFEETVQLLGPKSLLENHKGGLGNEKEIETAVSYTCGRNIAVVQQALLRKETWALKMLDASSKIPSGLLTGNLIDIGMYDECIQVHGKSLGFEIRGRHCMYSIRATHGNATLPIDPTLSICLPSNCTANDIVGLFNGTLNIVSKFKDIGITIDSATCTPIDKKVWDTELIVCTVILLVFVGFLVSCSIIDALNGRLDAGEYRHPAVIVLSRFSLQKNAAAILSMKIPEDNLPAIHGIRFLSIAWIALGHEYTMQIFAVNVNTLDIFEWVQSWKSLYIFVTPFAVDTFFVLSGFLMTYIFLKQIPKQKRFNVPLYYLHRFLRLTPSVIALLVFTIVFVPKMGSGARWDTTLNLFVGHCRTKWWPILLYVPNFVDQDNMCLAHLWYLAVDMQLFLISPFILYPLYKKPKVGLGIFVFLFLASLAVPSSIVGINKYPALSFTHVADVTRTMDIFKNVYEMPYNRASPWLLGILLGFEVANKHRRLSGSQVYVGWLLAITSFAFCTFGIRSFMEPSYEYNVVWETIFSTISRPIWAFGVCWIIYASILNHAGPVSKILSWPGFLPLSRLTYCIYLVHLVLQVMRVSALRTSTYFSDNTVWQNYLSDFTISIIVAFIFSLLFESPIVALEKTIFRRKRESRSESQKELIPSHDEEATTQNE